MCMCVCVCVCVCACVCLYVHKVQCYLTPLTRVYEKMMERMQELGATVTGAKKVLADWAKRKGLEGNKNFLKK